MRFMAAMGARGVKAWNEGVRHRLFFGATETDEALQPRVVWQASRLFLPFEHQVTGERVWP